MATAPGQLAPGVLPHQEILGLCGLAGNELPETEEQGPIQPCRRENVRSASYDLRLGPEYHFSSPSKVSKLRRAKVTQLSDGRDEQIVLGPNQVVVVSCLEKVCMPKDMVGHLTLKQDILLQGLIMASQSQIDAGYEGWIYPLLYNLTDGEVSLQLGKSIIRLELVRLAEATDRPYEGDYQEQKLARSLRRPIGSSLTALRKEVGKSRKQIWQTRALGFLGALALAALPFVTGFVGEVHDTRDRVLRVEGQIDQPLQLEDELRTLESQIDALQCKVREAESQPKTNRC